MSDFVEYATNFLKRATRNPAKDLELNQSTLKRTTIKQQFDNFVRQHFMVDTMDYLCMLACQQSYSNPANREPTLDNKTIYQPQLSTDRIAVYIRGNYVFKTMIIAIHGTKPTNIEDIIQDGRLVLGMVKDTPITTKYLIQLMDIIRTSGLPRDNIYIAGHSLSAYYSLLAGFVSNTNVRTFNGVNELISLSDYPNDVRIGTRFYSLSGMNTYKNAIAYRMFGDPISLLNKWSLPDVITIKVDNMSVNPLTLHSLDYMIEVCVPDIPLDKSSVSRARRFNRLPVRGEMETEGNEFDILRAEAEDTVFDKLLRLMAK